MKSPWGLYTTTCVGWRAPLFLRLTHVPLRGMGKWNRSARFVAQFHPLLVSAHAFGYNVVVKVAVRTKPAERKLPTPRSIYNHLTTYVVGQEHAKRVLALAAYNHLKRCRATSAQKTLLRKSNVLLMGPTGCGKTRLAHTLAEILEVPFSLVDITEYTQAGYHGKDIEHLFVDLLYQAHHDPEVAQQGIVFIDEIDKLARRATASHASVVRDIGGEGVQQALLTLLEGRDVTVPLSHTHRKQDTLVLNTTDVLFVAAGTFSDLYPSSQRALGFGNSAPSNVQTPSTEKLCQYGMLAELLGRMPLRAQLTPLTEEQLVSILTDPPDALVREYEQWLALDEVHLHFTSEALLTLARRAHHTGTGARALRPLMDQVCHELMFEAPESKPQHFTITKEYAEHRLQMCP